MAYFSNGSEGFEFDCECSDCLLYDEPCPIAMVQLEHNYDTCNNQLARTILNRLVKQDENMKYIGCQMKPLIDKLKNGNDENPRETKGKIGL
jgi:uncharacterized OB-fold protein